MGKNNYDDKEIERILKSLDINDILRVQLPAGDAYLFCTLARVAASHPMIDDITRSMGLDKANEVETIVCKNTGMPRHYQLSEHFDTDEEGEALFDKHFSDALPVTFQLTAPEGFNMVGLMQVSTRHPNIPDNIKTAAIKFGRGIQTLLLYSTKSNDLYRLMELGWDPANDV